MAYGLGGVKAYSFVGEKLEKSKIKIRAIVKAKYLIP